MELFSIIRIMPEASHSIQIDNFLREIFVKILLFWNDIQGKQDLSDQILVQKILGGEKKFFEVLVNRYSQKLFRYLYHYFHFSKDTSQDVLQEVFVQVWKNLGKYDQQMKFESRIYKIAHNLSIDRLRKNSQTNLTFGNTKKDSEGNNIEIGDITAGDENVRQNADKKYKIKLVRELLDKLEGENKTLIILYYFEQKSYDEISSIINKNPGTIRVQMHRAKEKLKEIITNDPLLSQALVFDLE